MTTIAARNAAFLVFASRFTDSDFAYSEEFRRTLDAALEAAAPHMLAEVWDEGCEAMHATTGGEWPPIHEDNPYRNPYRSKP